MKRNSRILSFLLAALLLLAAVTPGFADDDYVSGQVVFTNKHTKEAPYALTVTKYVLDENGARVDTSEAFTFQLMLDDGIAQNQKYQLFVERNGAAEELLLCRSTGDGETKELLKSEYDALDEAQQKTWIPIDRVTDMAGQFELKADQTAAFPELNPGTRVWIQETCPADYRLVEITADGMEKDMAQGTVEGTLPKDGAKVEYTNQKTPPPDHTDGPLELRINKRIVPAPDGLQTADGTEEFRFRILIDGEPWANRPYKVYGSGNDLVRQDTTTAEGIAILGGDQTAVLVLQGVPEGASYQVTEVEIPTTWQPDGSTEQSGELENTHVELSFWNRNASFGVKKRMLDNSTPEVDFRFLLMQVDAQSQKTPWPGAEFIRYDAQNKPVTGTPEYTDDLGGFTLRPGQTILFRGITVGSSYYIEELFTQGYTLDEPLNGAYGTVRQQSVTVWSFVNKQSTNLKVSKIVSTAPGITPEQLQEMRDISFTFTLLNNGMPAAGESYRLNGGENRYTTDQNGCFRLKHGQWAEFDRLASGRYEVVEAESTYKGRTFYAVGGSTKSGYLDTANPEGLSFDFENTVNGIFNLELKKVDEKTENPLAGVEFVLQKLNSQGTADTGTQPLTLVTDENGMISAGELLIGSYRLTETRAPEGYQKLPEEGILFDVTMVDGALALVYRNTVLYGAGNICEEGQTIPLADRDGIPTITLELKNYKPIVLPESGGMGTEVFTLSGALLIGMSLLALAWKRRARS